MKNTVIGGEDEGGPVTVALYLQECQDNSWLDINQFPDGHPEFEDRVAEDKYQKIGDIEDKLEYDGATDGQAEGSSQEIDHNTIVAEDGPGDEDGLEHGGENAIADPEPNGIEVYGDRSHSRGGHKAGVGGNAEGWCYPRASFVSELTLQFQDSRTPGKRIATH